jgi:hypothetical protein
MERHSWCLGNCTRFPPNMPLVLQSIHPPTKTPTAAPPVRTGARKKNPPAAAKTASRPMSEVMIQNLIKKGKPEMSQWVVALQDVGTDKPVGKRGLKTTVFEKNQKMACQIAKA